MISDYQKYLLKIRNSLIRSGVELNIEDISDYGDLFHFGEKLSDLLWFYSILEISGSEDKLKDFMFPLNSHYSTSLRDKYFEEYLLYRADYMSISASDLVFGGRKEEDIWANISSKEENDSVEDVWSNILDSSSNEEEDNLVEEVPWDIKNSYSLNDSLDDDDEFIDSSESSSIKEVKEVNILRTEPFGDDEFIIYGDKEDTKVETIEDEEDEFINWGSSEDEKDTENEEDTLEEDGFVNWSNSDEEEIVEEEDDFVNWGSSDDDISEEEDEEYEDTFSSWGNSDESDDIEEPSEEEYEDEDVFGSWGSSEDDDTIEDSAEDDYEEEDVFGNWGSSEETSTDSDELDGTGVVGRASTLNTSSIPSKNTDGTNVKARKSKLEYEMESNEKTAKVIEKIATGIFSKGGLLKSKVSEKFKNLDDF